MERVRETFTLKELCQVRRNIKRENVGLPEGRCTAACITETHHTLTLDQPTRIHYRTIDIKQINPSFMQISESCEPTTSQPSTCWAQSETLLVVLSLPIGRIVSQSQSWLSLSRPKGASSFLTLIRLFHKQPSDLISTLCNVTGE